MTHIGKGLDSLSSKYSYVLVGAFNAESSNNFLDGFCESCNLKSVIKKLAWFKNLDNPTFIDLILSKDKKVFKILLIQQQGYLSDFHKPTLTMLKIYFLEVESKKFICCDYENFSNQQFWADLIKELRKNNCDVSQFELFLIISLRIFE